uniref:Putative secreted protein n=1 Tax=Ixodes ricinus TaxID=34613 RepID=A0A6B0TZH5_IXORI
MLCTSFLFQCLRSILCCLIFSLCFSDEPFDTGNVMCSSFPILSPPLASHSHGVPAFCGAYTSFHTYCTALLKLPA